MKQLGDSKTLRNMPSVVPLAAGVVYVFLVMPSLIIIPISFGNPNEFEFPPTDLSLELYRQYFFTSNWVEVTIRSGQIALLAAILGMSIAVPGAYALSRMSFPGKQLITVLLLSPILVPIIVVGLGLYLYLSALRINGTFLGIVLTHTLYIAPFIIITMMAGIRQLDERLEVVASIMGAGRVRVFFAVVLPQLTPSLVSAFLFAFLMSFDEVILAWFVSGAGTMTLPVKMYSSIQWESSPVLAAVSTILTLLSVAICLVAVAAARGRESAAPDVA